MNSNGGTVVCHNTIGCASRDIVQLLSIIAWFLTIVWVPSVSILVAATVWSCAIFKKSYAGHDTGLTRRIVAMLLVMPVIASVISIEGFAFKLYRVVNFVTLQTLVSNSFSRNWNASLKYTVALLIEIVIIFR
jgi:hypothetical protein